MVVYKIKKCGKERLAATSKEILSTVKWKVPKVGEKFKIRLENRFQVL